MTAKNVKIITANGKVTGRGIRTRWARSCLLLVFPPVHCRALDASHPPDLIGAYRFFPVPARAPKAAQENAQVAQKVAREFLPLF